MTPAPRTLALPAVFLLLACLLVAVPGPTFAEPARQTDEADADTDTDADADADADADSDSDSDSDADSDPDLGTGLRVVHAAAGVVSQDLVVNGTLPPVLQNLSWLSSTIYSPRPPNTYSFQFVDAGDDVANAWTTFDFELLRDRRHTMVVYGDATDKRALAVVDDDEGIPQGKARIRWTHAAPALPYPIDLFDVGSGTTIASDLPYGGTIEMLAEPVVIDTGLDLDGDGTPEFTFAGFQRPAGDYFHVMVTNEIDGTLFLLGQSRAGETPRRDLVP